MKTRANGPTVLLAVILVSCSTKNDASIELAAICAPPEDATKCTFSATCDAVLMDRPMVATRKYLRTSRESLNFLALPIQINNRLKSNADDTRFRVNTQDFTVEEFRLSFSSSPGMSLPSRTYPVNQLIPANGSSVVMVKAIPEETMATIDAANLATLFTPSIYAPNAYVDVEIRAYGHTRDGQSIETEAWTVPVDVMDVDYAGTTRLVFDPACPGTTGVVNGICPNAAQSPSRISCST